MVRIIENSGLLSEANPYHDAKGRFTTKGGPGGAGGVAPDVEKKQVDSLRSYALSEDDQETDAWLKLRRGDIDSIDDLNPGSLVPSKDLRGNRNVIDRVHTIDSAFDNPKLATTFKDPTRVHALPGEIGQGVPAGQTRNQWSYTLVSQTSKPGSTPLDLPAGSKAIPLSVTKPGSQFPHPNQDAMLLPRGLQVTAKADGSFAVTGKAVLKEANPYHDAKGRFTSKGGGPGYGGAATLEEAIGNAMEDIRGVKGGESAIALNDDGSVAFTKTHNGDLDGSGPNIYGVRFSESEADRMRGKVHVHNHPPTDAYGEHPAAFSTSDIRFAATVQPKEMRLADHTGTNYTLRPGPDGWGAPIRAQQEVAMATNQARVRFGKELRSGRMTRGEAESKASEFVVQQVADRLGWQFEVQRP